MENMAKKLLPQQKRFTERGFDNEDWNKENIRKFLKENINDIIFVETLIKYLDDKLKRNRKKVELRCNLSDLINDLDYLKQYLDS